MPLKGYNDTPVHVFAGVHPCVLHMCEMSAVMTLLCALLVGVLLETETANKTTRSVLHRLHHACTNFLPTVSNRHSQASMVFQPAKEVREGIK